MNKIASQKKEKLIMMGNEAIARGAIEAGVEFVAAYPGTPSSEIVETLAEVASKFDYYVEWSMNEKVAFDVAAGASLTGKRSLVAMKNAGLNVAMDTFMTLPYTGIKGGMVIVVADDPNAHYSSNEQDTRAAAAYAEIPCLEPADQQEAKEMTAKAFEISEELELPVFLRSVTRISHASGDVLKGDIKNPPGKLGFNKHWEIPYRWNVYGPPGPVDKHAWLHKQMEKAVEVSNRSEFNHIVSEGDGKTGVISSGLGFSYALEAVNELGLENKISILKLGCVNPLPREVVGNFLKNLDEVVVVEEGDPVVEKEVISLAKELDSKINIYGKKQKQILAPYGELNVDRVIKALSKVMDMRINVDNEREKTKREIEQFIAPRSSTLCAGCPHLGTYWALKEVLNNIEGVHIVNGDIGCYEQGGYGVFANKIEANDEDSKAYPLNSPYEILDSIYVMGSGIGMAIGQAHANYKDGKVIAVAGDSTFFHGTMPAVADAVYTEADITFLVMDNSWTCMTGHQPNPTTGMSTTGGEAKTIDITAVSKSLGIKEIEVVDAYNLDNCIDAIQKSINYCGPSVVIIRRECALQVQRREKIESPKTYVEQETCIGCGQCLELGCPAIAFDNENDTAEIDTLLCVDCGLCNQICPVNAILEKGE